MGKIFKYIVMVAIITATVGITFIVLGMSFGASIKDVNFDMTRVDNYSNNKPVEVNKEITVPSLDNIHSIDFELDGVTVDISYGEEYAVTTNDEQLISQENDKGRWKIKTIRPLMNDKIFNRVISITIPKDAILQEISISLNGSSLIANDLMAKEIDIDGAAADISLKNSQCDTLELDLKAGAIDFSGDVTKKIEAECNVGDITINVSRPKSYRYEIETGLGEISIDGEKFSGINSKSNGSTGTNEGKTVFYSLECNVGNIKINLE